MTYAGADYTDVDAAIKRANSLNKDKIITIGILPIMWLVYFLFEIISGRVKDFYTLILNLSLLLVFALVGAIIYKCSTKNLNGLNNRSLIITFLILMLLDQGLKVIIKTNFFHYYFEIIPDFLSFNPIINISLTLCVLLLSVSPTVTPS